MKYDFTRCNNLNFKVKDNGGKVREGYLKVSSNGNVYLYYLCENKIFNPYLQIEYNSYYLIFTDTMNFHEWAERHELEIISRDPETYNDWKVGDKVVNIKHGDVYTIAALAENAAVLTMDAGDYTALTKTDALTKYYKLVLTDYEQELLNAKGQDVCPFKNGDRVLVRDDIEETWVFGILDSYRGGNEYPYKCEFECYRQCIPYNEKTWQLLGTTDEYKEE